MRQDAMTTAQILRTPARRLRRWTVALLGPISLAMSACAGSGPALENPDISVAPYTADGREVLLAVLPVRNESGAGVVDVFEISDALVKAATETRGLRALPLNRTLSAMRLMGLETIDTPEDALAVADVLGADAALFGVVTAYDPYDPPTLGLSLALFGRSPAMIGSPAALPADPIAIAGGATDHGAFPASSYADGPLSTISEVYDARNHQVQRDLIAYARGRHDPEGPLGFRIYTARMDLYTAFAAATAVDRLMQEERLRLARDRVARGRAQPRASSDEDAWAEAGYGVGPGGG